MSTTLGEVNEAVVSRWDAERLPEPEDQDKATKSPTLMNYLIESALDTQERKCPIKMTTVKGKDYLVDLFFPDPAQAVIEASNTTHEPAADALCTKLKLSSTLTGQELHSFPLCNLTAKRPTPEQPCPFEISFPAVARNPQAAAQPTMPILIYDDKHLYSIYLNMFNATAQRAEQIGSIDLDSENTRTRFLRNDSTYGRIVGAQVVR